MTDLHLHVGAHKTGSTLLQAALNQDRERLAEAGTTLLTRGDLEPLASGLLNRWRGGEVGADRLSRVWAKVSERVRGDTRVLLSHEELLGGLREFETAGRLYPRAQDALRPVLDELQPDRVTVHLFTRRQDRFIESAYLQTVRMGQSHHFADWFERISSTALRWVELIERIEAVAGRPLVRYFEDISEGPRKYARLFYADTETGVEPALKFSVRNRNRGYSDVALQIALVANPLLERHDRRLVRTYLDQNLCGPRRPKPVLLDDRQRLAILESVADDNRRLHRVYARSEAAACPYLPTEQADEAS